MKQEQIIGQKFEVSILCERKDGDAFCYKVGNDLLGVFFTYNCYYNTNSQCVSHAKSHLTGNALLKTDDGDTCFFIIITIDHKDPQKGLIYFYDKEVGVYWNLLFSSISKVSYPLISYQGSGGECYLNERAFTYELYRQVANKLYEGKDLSRRPEVVINAEIYKHMNKNDNNQKYPDIVFHGGQDDKNGQLLICEVKVEASKDEVKEDLSKLLEFMDMEKMYNHPYALAVFINLDNVNTCCDRFEQALMEIDNVNKDSLVLVSYDKGHVTVI